MNSIEKDKGLLYRGVFNSGSPISEVLLYLLCGDY